MTKLTNHDVLRIKHLLDDGILSHAKIGRMFGVTRHAIRHIAIGNTHKSIEWDGVKP